MSMPNGRSPAPTDETGALDFENERPRGSSGVLTLYYQGVPMAFNVSDKTIGQIERWIAGMLKRGWTAPPVARGGFGGKADERIEAEKDAQGNEICPVHKCKVRTYEGKDGRPPFKGCPSKGTGAAGEKLNPRGYCSLRFR